MADQSLSFPKAIAITQDLMNQIADNQLTESEIKQEITSIIKDRKGGRGFFVSYLTSELTLADNPSQGVIDALKTTLNIVSELLIKNLAMSAAMVVAHERNQDYENAAASQKVRQRTKNLIQQIQSDLLADELQKLRATIEVGSGDYQSFLEHWDYDLQQKQAIQNAIDNTITSKK